MSAIRDVSWTVDGIVTDGLAGPTPDLTPGKTIRLSFVFHDRSVSATAFDQRYRDLRVYLAYQSEDVLDYGTSGGTPWFREQLPATSPVGSLVVPIEPGADVIDAIGLWGLVVDGTDNSEPIADLRQLELKVFVLGERGDYADRAAVKSALEDSVI